MEITKVNLKPSTKGIAKAYGRVTFDGLLTVDVTIMEKDQGPWVSFPGYKNQKDQKWYSSVFIEGKDEDTKIKSRILSEYHSMDTGNQAAGPEDDGSQTSACSKSMPF